MANRKSLTDDVEDYWSASTKRPNAFAETISIDEAKSILKSQPLSIDSGELEDVINFDGTPANVSTSSANSKSAVSLDNQSARYRPPTSTLAGTTSARSTTENYRGSMPALAAPGSVPAGLSNYQQSIEDVVGASAPKRAPTLTDIVKLEAEIKFLKRSLEEARNPDRAKIAPRETVRRMIMGQTYSLERYKSKEDKLQLLNETIAMHDGNTIIAAVLFLRDTIKPSIFNQELISRPVAVEHYIIHLKQQYELEKLMDFLGLLGRNEEAAMLKYRQALAARQTDVKLRNIQSCHRSHFQMDQALAHDASLITEHIQLLERQLPIESADQQEVAKGSMLFKQIPRVSSILDMPVITTLYYCCLYYYALGENNLASPMAIKKAHKLSDKQFAWTVVRSRGRLKRWQDLEPLFQVKGWLGGVKLKAPMGFERLVPVLRKLDAPREIMNKYCNLIEPLDARLDVGQKFGCHESVIDTYVSMKDRLQLMAYQNKLKANSQEWFYATDVLRTSTIRWRN